MPPFPKQPPKPSLPVPDAASLAKSLKLMAENLGFDACRIANAAPAQYASFYHEFLEEGRHGEMRWLEKTPERRTNPQLVLKGAKSMIVLALSYAVKDADCELNSSETSSPAPAKGIISRYARGEDYHRIAEEKLTDLTLSLEAYGGLSRAYVDTGPILERNWASESGLGWGGKSTVQIHPRLGTWFFLCTILTTLELKPDKPHPDRCGSCTRCIVACPTRAIIAPRKLDARRCISYLTIEHTGPIPLEFRRAMGARIYGCDDCLAVCPWNRFAKQSRHLRLAPRAHWQDLSLRAMLELGQERYKKLIAQSPMSRAKWPQFARNVCVALGNVGTKEDLPALKTAAQSPEPLIAEHAQWAIAEIEKRSNDEQKS